MYTGFYKEVSGQVQQTKSEATLWTLQSDGHFRGVSISVSDINVVKTVTLTGWWAQAADGTILWETTSGKYISFDDGWSTAGVENHSQAQAQDYVNKMIANNKTILENNLLCARFSSKLTAQQRQTLYDLQTRLQERNQHLLDDGLVTVQKQSEAYGYNYLNSYLSSFMQSGGVGLVISTTMAIVIACVVVASLSTAAYFAYKALYNESEQDVKFSKELTATLRSKLTEEEYQQLLNETAGILTKEKIFSKFSGAGNLIKYALLAAGGYFVYKFITSKKQS